MALADIEMRFSFPLFFGGVFLGATVGTGRKVVGTTAAAARVLCSWATGSERLDARPRRRRKKNTHKAGTPNRPTARDRAAVGHRDPSLKGRVPWAGTRALDHEEKKVALGGSHCVMKTGKQIRQMGPNDFLPRCGMHSFAVAGHGEIPQRTKRQPRPALSHREGQ
ncbi:hypothetical protein TW95_gp1586 [Pandoravirus inopinatum]|uniref:Uncharacterized protein n=1 Tax=Pandoravirus inopinatum TaxID=1605721 RepID=A0A0B5J8Q1_9VIRU|nr:hypothetical protein TW95_gp1586 [Pandoravirus inopinatum]AJF98320.1 hypothetical protein [Pandoravirus inopinatum]